MKRTQMTRTEKDLVAKLAKICAYSEYIHANLVAMERVCGNKNCKCAREGKKHKSLYLVTIKRNGDRKMIYIPKRLEEKTKIMVDRYFRIKETVEKISDINLSRLMKEKCLEEF